jgi:hypothetical protein
MLYSNLKVFISSFVTPHSLNPFKSSFSTNSAISLQRFLPRVYLWMSEFWTGDSSKDFCLIGFRSICSSGTFTTSIYLRSSVLSICSSFNDCEKCEDLCELAPGSKAFRGESFSNWNVRSLWSIITSDSLLAILYAGSSVTLFRPMLSVLRFYWSRFLLIELSIIEDLL